MNQNYIMREMMPLISKKRGFTLVELLLIIIIIAVLAGMQIIIMGSATGTAEASRIINDLRMLQAAALSYYLDNDGIDNIGPGGSATPLPAAEVKSISAYLDREINGTQYSEIYILHDQAPTSSRLLLGVNYGSRGSDLGIINRKLRDNASGMGLVNIDGTLFSPLPTTDKVFIWLK